MLMPINVINKPKNLNHSMVLAISKLTAQEALNQKTRLETVPALLPIGSFKTNLAPNTRI